MPRRPRTPGLSAFLTTQFLGAFNDNAFRFAVLFMILDLTDGASAGRWKGLAQLVFALPFVVFAVWAGAFADRLPKSRIIVLAKLAEVVIMTAGVLAFGTGSLGVLVGVLLLMSTQSTMFGPAKYGWLAETVDEADLVSVNGLVQMTTMVAIVSGQVVGGVVYQAYRDDMGLGALWFVGFALVGVVASLGVPKVPAAVPGLAIPVNPFPDLRSTWRGVRSRPTLLYTMLGIGHFFLLAALLQLHLAQFGLSELGLGESTAATLVAMATLGIAAGSLLAGSWAERQVEMGLVPLGALTMSAGILSLAFVQGWPLPLPETWRLVLCAPQFPGDGLGGDVLPGLLGALRALLVDGWWTAFAATFFMGAAGGLFIVPLQAMLQRGAPVDEKGRYLAFGNMVSFVGIGLASVFLWLPEELGFSIRQQFLFAAGLGLVGTVVSLKLLPYAFLRLVAWTLAHTVYRIRVRGFDNVPERGPALVLCNHVSWVDALILAASTGRRLHFLMYRPFYEWWPLHWLYKFIGCIPVSGGEAPEATAASLEAAGSVLDEGRVVVVFAEGAVTRLGHMLPFRQGYQRIVGGRDVPIVPAYLDGLWGSLFSHQGGRLLWKRPRAFPYPVTVSFGAALPGDTTPHDARDAIALEATAAWGERRRSRLPLQRTLFHEGRRDGKTLLADARGSSSRRDMLARAWASAPLVRRVAGAERTLALALAPGRDGATLVLAALLAGKVVVPLDPRRDPTDLAARAQAAGAGLLVMGEGSPPDVAAAQVVTTADATAGAATGVSAGAATGAATGNPAVRVVDVDEVLIPGRAGLGRRLALGLLPWGLLRHLLFRGDGGADPDGAAMVLLAPGTAGPAPVTLSHFQLLANVEAMRDVLDPGPDFAVAGILPWEDVAGLVLTLWLPLLSGSRVVWHDDPEDLRLAGKLMERHRSTMLVVTPGHLDALVDQARPDSLGGVQLLLAAGEPVSEEQAAAAVLRFGLEPRPLLALAEAGGVVTLSTPDVRSPGIFQRGTRQGSVGHPLPGVTVEIVDRDGVPLADGETGQVVVRGPSVVGDDGILHTGLTGLVDRHGFLFLSDARRPTSSGPEAAS